MDNLNNSSDSNQIIPNNHKTQQSGVSDREMLRIIKEEKNFPQKFSKRIKLSLLLKYYYKYWNHDFTDEESDTDEDRINN